MSDELSKIVAKDVFVDYRIKEAVKKAQKIALQFAPQALQQGAGNYATTAAKVMPPPKDKKGDKGLKIAQQLYWRDIYPIKYFLKYPDKIDKVFDKKRVKVNVDILRSLLQQGNWYILIGYKDRGKHQFVKVGKNKNELKQKYGRIKYRGLYKWLWGAGFQDLGWKTPVAFRRLQNASPALEQQKKLVQMQLFKDDKKVRLKEQYKADGIDYFAKRAEQKALRSTLNKMKKLIQKKINEEIKNV